MLIETGDRHCEKQIRIISVRRAPMPRDPASSAIIFAPYVAEAAGAQNLVVGIGLGRAGLLAYPHPLTLLDPIKQIVDTLRSHANPRRRLPLGDKLRNRVPHFDGRARPCIVADIE